MRRPFIAGNWKMYKTIAEAEAFAETFKEIYKAGDVLVAIAAPYTQLSVLKTSFKGTNVKLCAQNMHFEDEGAFTGEISARMLKELGVDYCIIGHSERREYFGETDQSVNRKLKAALDSGIRPICCVGESLKTREEGRALAFVKQQIVNALDGLTSLEMRQITIAYEPIWAIGTGRTATPEQANEMCAFIRAAIQNLYGENVSEETIIQYGGSVKPANASELMCMGDIDGALVGGASLVPEDFLEIIQF
ncbi:MAG: triose-phosphate isomerase [Clostridia bacterium]|nr:triose-phosphate isomerase [Clostridia bacterium]